MNASSPSPDPIPAATLVIFRNGRTTPEPELLLTVRSKTMSFAGGMAVFPGGRLDPADYELAASLVDGGQVEEMAHRIAAIRETLEETGLAIAFTGQIDATRAADMRAAALKKGALAPVLDDFSLGLDLASLTPFARWLPLGLAHHRIFDTRFYLANLGTGSVDVEVDATENTRLFWVSAREALAMADRGDISIIFPTRRNLERLAQFTDFDKARHHAECTPLRTVTPWVEDTPDGPQLTIPDDLGYPVCSEPLTSANRA